MNNSEIERLKEKVKKLKEQVKELKDFIRVRLEEEELHENVMEIAEDLSEEEEIEENELPFPTLSDNFTSFISNPKKLPYMTRFTSSEFTDFITEVSPAIASLNWRGQPRSKRMRASPPSTWSRSRSA